MRKILLGIGLALLTYQCDKEDDENDTSKTDKNSATVADCPEAVSAFAEIQTAIDNTGGCAKAGCHVTPNGGNTTLYFVANNAKANRKVLAGHDEGFWKEAGNLFKKIGPNYASHGLPTGKTEGGHSGGAQASPTETQITNWTTAESRCP